MNRPLAVITMVLLAAAAAHGEAPPADPWLHATAYVDRDCLPRGTEFHIAVVLDIDKGYHLNANPPSLDFLIPVAVEPGATPAVRWGGVSYPAGKEFLAAWATDAAVRVYEDHTVILVRGTVAADTPLGPTTLRLQLSYQGCDAESCHRPDQRTLEVSTRIVAAGDASSPTNADIFSPFAAAPTASPTAAAPSPTAAASPPGSAAPALLAEGERDLAADFRRSPLAALGFLFLLGLAMNLTGCTFPLIPVTMTVFAQQGESRWSKVLPLALVYALGLATTFAAVGVIAGLTGQGLALVLQQPVGKLVLVVILAAMMASLFGAFEFQLPPALMGRLSARQGYLGAAFMGMVMGAVATPCVGPVLAGLITMVAQVASTTTTTAAVALGALAFFVTGLGVALPYVVLGLFTGLINRFPHGGGWLVWSKRLMAMALAGVILYYLQQFIAVEFYWPLVLAVFLFAAIYLGLLEGLDRRPFTRKFVAVRLAAGGAILAAGLLVYADGTAARPEVAWFTWRPDSLDTAQAAHRPVVLYFGADWCLECKQWHRRIFADPAVIRASASFTPIYVDVTALPAGPKKDFAAQFHGQDPPLVVLIDREGNIRKVLREVPTPAEFIETIKLL
jgi:thiol:disulfide interchange protein DsbD